MKLSSLLALCLPLLSKAVDLPTLPANIEVDVIFPRNETYSPADNFPVILAVQNAALAFDFGFYVNWNLRNYTSGRKSPGIVQSEVIVQSNSPKVAPPGETFFIVNHTNYLEAARSRGTGTYRLSWEFTLVENCTRDGDFINHTIGATQTRGQLFFTIANDGKAVDLTEGGPCPVAGGVVGIQSNLTGCAHVDNSGVEASPCNIVVDDSLASSLSAQLPPITTSTPTTTSSGTKVTTSATTTGTASQAATTTSTGTNAANRGAFQTPAAIFAGAAGLCAVLMLGF